jgi:hypothetical protein
MLSGVTDEDAAAPDPVFEALWKRVLEAWDDDKPHTALLDHALRSQSLPEVAGRYRALVDDPEKGALAKKRVDAVVMAATQLLMSTKTPKAAKVPLSITLTAFAICMLLLGWLAYQVFGRH